MDLFKKIHFYISRAPKRIAYFFRRKKYDKFLRRKFYQTHTRSQETFLIDGSFDNPNYWLRVSLIIEALGVPTTNCLGFLGEYRRFHLKNTFRRLGIAIGWDLDLSLRRKQNSQALIDCNRIKSDAEFLDFYFPYNFPADIFYDFVLKRQRGAQINFDDVNLPLYFVDLYNTLDIGHQIFSSKKIDHLICSHAIGWHACIVWMALKFKVQVTIPFGDNGLPKFWKLRAPEAIYDLMDCLKASDEINLTPDQKESLIKMGEEAMNERIHGQTRNLGAIFAYKKRNTEIGQQDIRREYDWNDVSKPIIAVYASNWFDFPHTFGMKNFLNFFDWITATLEFAKSRKDVYWLFKGHPADDWYGGVTLESLISFDGHPHVKLADKSWNGFHMLKACQGIITCHGTIGIEAPIFRTPVLLCDRGWYDEIGFATKSNSRAEYFSHLQSDWWNRLDLEERRTKALLFGGVYWGKCSWQENLLLGDDSEGESLIEDNIKLISLYPEELKQELNHLVEWYNSESEHYNTFKLLRHLLLRQIV